MNLTEIYRKPSSQLTENEFLVLQFQDEFEDSYDPEYHGGFEEDWKIYQTHKDDILEAIHQKGLAALDTFFSIKLVLDYKIYLSHYDAFDTDSVEDFDKSVEKLLETYNAKEVLSEKNLELILNRYSSLRYWGFEQY